MKKMLQQYSLPAALGLSLLTASQPTFAAVIKTERYVWDNLICFVTTQDGVIISYTCYENAVAV